MPLTQVGTVGAPEPRMLTVQVWDRSLVGAVEKAIRDCGLGLNPASDGQLVRVPIPQLTTERRTELVEDGAQICRGRQGRGARACGATAWSRSRRTRRSTRSARTWRRTGSAEVQKLTDQYIKRVDDVLAEKEKDIRQV